MCGIAGEFCFDGRRPDPRQFQKMVMALVRRGPDDEGAFFDGSLALGHRRLSVIDLSVRSHQPMVDKALGLAVVFNGTLYNYRALRQELIQKGHQFFSEGDTEVILKAYAVWGEACVERFIGMFAFGLWDQRQQTLFLARDRLGIKPLYYKHTRYHLRFASTTQALLAAGDVNTSLDPIALHHHLTLHAVVPAPRTLLKGIRKVPPATTLTIDRYGRIRQRHYWLLPAQRPAVILSARDWQERVEAQLRVAVQRRLEAADVPVGILLSGGLDSSLLVALACEISTREVLTFSIGFEDQPEEQGSEFEYSDAVVERYATRHHRYRIANSEVLNRLPEAVEQMAEPMVSQDAIAFYLLAEQVSKTVKVVQSGQGADEVFGGYFWYPRMNADTGSDLARFSRHYFDRTHDDYLETVTLPYQGPDYTAALVGDRLDAVQADEFLDRVLHFDVTTLIVDDPIKRVDNMTMAWGLEARVPFLDHELVELAMQMPPRLKIHNGVGKAVLKQMARGRLPDAVIDRPKGYFPLPALKYVRGAFLDFMRDILDTSACRQRYLFQRDMVDRLLSAPDDEAHFTKLRGSKLWHLALLELWLQRCVDKAPI